MRPYSLCRRIVPDPDGGTTLDDLSQHLDTTPAFTTVAGWQRLTGMRRSSTYDALAAGHLRGVKRGRSLLLDVPHGLAWLRSLPAATIKKAA